MTATAQQTSTLRQQNRNKKPRKAFCKDLIDSAEGVHDKGHGVPLVGDSNEAAEPKCDGMTELMSGCELIDMMCNEIDCDNFNTHIRGKERIDFVLADQWACNCTTAACCEPFQCRTKGDHWNILPDFDCHRLFRNPTCKTDTPTTRDFSCKDASNDRKHIENRCECLVGKNCQQRTNDLEKKWNLEEAKNWNVIINRHVKVRLKSVK